MVKIVQPQPPSPAELSAPQVSRSNQMIQRKSEYHLHSPSSEIRLPPYALPSCNVPQSFTIPGSVFLSVCDVTEVTVRRERRRGPSQKSVPAPPGRTAAPPPVLTRSLPQPCLPRHSGIKRSFVSPQWRLNISWYHTNEAESAKLQGV